MRTISIRLDDQTDSVLRAFCERHGLSQTDALKEAIHHLAENHRATPAELADQLGLIGSFGSGVGNLAENHSRQIKSRLRAKLAAESVPASASASASNRRRAKAA